MRKIDNVKKEIYLTKGDSFPLKFTARNKETQEPYILQPGDIVRFAVKKTYKDPDPLFYIDSDTYYITIEPEHTEDLQAGKYVFDVQLTFADGEKFTYIGETDTVKPKFILWNEVAR